MTYHYYGDKNADIVLIQPVGDHDLPEIENEVAEIKKLTSVDFQLIACVIVSPPKNPGQNQMFF